MNILVKSGRVREGEGMWRRGGGVGGEHIAFSS